MKSPEPIPMVVEKICHDCGLDVSAAPRTKDKHGRYFCKSCFHKRKQAYEAARVKQNVALAESVESSAALGSDIKSAPNDAKHRRTQKQIFFHLSKWIVGFVVLFVILLAAVGIAVHEGFGTGVDYDNYTTIATPVQKQLEEICDHDIDDMSLRSFRDASSRYQELYLSASQALTEREQRLSSWHNLSNAFEAINVFNAELPEAYEAAHEFDGTDSTTHKLTVVPTKYRLVTYWSLATSKLQNGIGRGKSDDAVLEECAQAADLQLPDLSTDVLALSDGSLASVEPSGSARAGSSGRTASRSAQAREDAALLEAVRDRWPDIASLMERGRSEQVSLRIQQMVLAGLMHLSDAQAIEGYMSRR